MLCSWLGVMYDLLGLALLGMAPEVKFRLSYRIIIIERCLYSSSVPVRPVLRLVAVMHQMMETYKEAKFRFICRE